MSAPTKTSGKQEFSFFVNRKAERVRAHPMERLLDVLRVELGLNGANEGFREGECGGAQCGICTPGMILAAVHLLDRQPQPTLEQIKEGLSGNLCRCTGYMQIFEAIQKVARGESAR